MHLYFLRNTATSGGTAKEAAPLTIWDMSRSTTAGSVAWIKSWVSVTIYVTVASLSIGFAIIPLEK
jgi:hypothetical protein